MKESLRLGFFLLLLSAAAPAWTESRMAQVVSSGGIVENDVVRYDARNEFMKPIREIRSLRSDYSAQNGEPSVRFEIVLKKSAVYYLFLNRTPAGYPGNGKGNYLIKRSRSTGRFELIQVFFRDYDREEGDCSLVVRPRNDESSLDVFLFGRKLYHDLRLATSFEKLLTAPLSTLFEMAKGTVDWPRLLVTGGREEDRRMAAVVHSIAQELPRVQESADGAIDRNGRFVTIADGRPQRAAKGLNCSGFAKWIIDGFYFPITGGYLDVDLLKTKRLESRGNRWSALRENRDPYFGLDWTRNLAISLAEARTGAALDNESCDVRQVPFFDYAEDNGYRISDLYHVLYFLAVDRPGTAFLGTVNDISTDNPLLVEYFHVAAFFPYFDGQGRFRVAVMDQHKDQNIFRFIDRYPSTFVHLVRFDVDSDFSLLRIE